MNLFFVGSIGCFFLQGFLKIRYNKTRASAIVVSVHNELSIASSPNKTIK
jgi:hypothetical protein